MCLAPGIHLSTIPLPSHKDKGESFDQAHSVRSTNSVPGAARGLERELGGTGATLEERAESIYLRG
jgi:hypothetical protein